MLLTSEASNVKASTPFKVMLKEDESISLSGCPCCLAQFYDVIALINAKSETRTTLSSHCQLKRLLKIVELRKIKYIKK